MKCPKCEYLGFETGDRCKLCGYDFSLSPQEPLAFDDVFRDAGDAGRTAGVADAEMPWRQDAGSRTVPSVTPDGWLHEVDHAVLEAPSPEEIRVPPAASSTVEPERAPLLPPPAFRGRQSDRGAVVPDLAALPLFLSGSADDTPLVTLPAKPRQPLAVRRTPDTPRLRVLPHAELDTPELDFQDEPTLPPQSPRGVTRQEGPVTDLVAGRRAAAAALDLAVLLGIDAVVLYFTLRMTGLGGNEMLTLPLLPLGIFLAMVKVGYFAAFTTVGGQTIGKMAAGIRVVGGDLRPVGAAVALRRTLVSAIDVLTFGLAYLPALIGTDRRAVHDRVAGTRVVARQQA